MKRLFLPVMLAAALSGCVAIPYDDAYVAYPDEPVYYSPYAVAPGYVVPGPVYGPPVYVGPPIRFSFGLNYWSGHGHGHGFGRHRGGFGHGFGGGRGGWRH